MFEHTSTSTCQVFICIVFIQRFFLCSSLKINERKLMLLNILEKEAEEEGNELVVHFFPFEPVRLGNKIR